MRKTTVKRRNEELEKYLEKWVKSSRTEVQTKQGREGGRKRDGGRKKEGSTKN